MGGPICLPGRQVRLLRKVRLLQNLTDEDLQKHHIDVATWKRVSGAVDSCNKIIGKTNNTEVPVLVQSCWITAYNIKAKTRIHSTLPVPGGLPKLMLQRHVVSSVRSVRSSRRKIPVFAQQKFDTFMAYDRWCNWWLLLFTSYIYVFEFLLVFLWDDKMMTK